MNPANPSQAANGHHAQAGFNLDDAVFTLFRHKWLILGFVCLGVAGAIGARLVRPPLYVSKAKLMVHYVLDSREATSSNPEGQRVQTLDAGAQNIINDEIEILTSRDVAVRVADIIGPEKILAKFGGGTNRMAAASVICAGIEVDPPKSSILTISFKHPDADVVQPTLAALLQAYMRRHLEIRQGVGVLDGYYSGKRDEWRKRLAQTEEELKHLKTQANVLFMDETKRSYQAQIAKVQDELLDAERELAERKAVLGNLSANGSAQTNSSDAFVPAEKLSDYSFAAAALEDLKKQEYRLLLTRTEANPEVQTVRAQIDKLAQKKNSLETEFPSLSLMTVGGTRGSTNAVGGDVVSDLAEIRKLNARVGALGMIMSNIQAQATRVMDVEPKMTELERQRIEAQKSYDAVMLSLEQTQKGESAVAGKVINMSIVQDPTLPGLDNKKMMKLIGAVFAGCVALGLGLAFLIDLFLDRSIKRTSDIERHLRLPVFLSIPDTSWPGWLCLPSWLRRSGGRRAESANHANGNGAAGGGTAVVHWDAAQQLQTYAEGLRERVISYFEVHNLNLKKPKLVAVTGCSEGAGVSTLASGLAAALSKTGDGNVLLVDMNADQGTAHSFYRGKPLGVLSDVLEPDTRGEAQVQENLYLATIGNNGVGDKLVKVLPNRFTTLMPRLKASDYDYIIFDMPPVTQTSATPRLASYMDLALLVIESEKTRQHSAVRASALMREARANVAAVLNKHRAHVPAGLSQEA
jgi:polysaccharide biosynthesis transport protein